MKKRHICAVFSFCILCFVIFILRNRCVSDANEYWFGVWAMICCWLFHCWWIFLRRWMFLWRGIRKSGGLDGLVWFDWMRGWLGIGRRCSYARAYARSRTRSFVFLLSQVSQWMEWKTYFTLKTTGRFVKSDRLFYEKWRVVLWKVTGCFMKSDVLFWIWGRKVVLRMVFWGFFGGE